MHLSPEVVPFPASLSHAGKYRVSSVLHGYIMYKLLYKHGLADSGASKQADFSTLWIWLQQVYDLYSGLQYLHHRPLLFKIRGLSVDLPSLLVIRYRSSSVYRHTKDVEHPAEGALSYRNAYAMSLRSDLHVYGHVVTGSQHDAAYHAVSHMLSHLHDTFLVSDRYLQRLFYPRKLSFLKFTVYYRTGDSDYLSSSH